MNKVSIKRYIFNNSPEDQKVFNNIDKNNHDSYIIEYNQLKYRTNNIFILFGQYARKDFFLQMKLHGFTCEEKSTRKIISKLQIR